MQTIRKINDDLAISGQITPEQFSQLTEQGFKSVLNLRSPHETNFPLTEQKDAEVLGLYYINLPFEIDAITDESVTQILQQIQRLPKPILVHCDTAIRAAAIALMHIATRQGATLEQAFKQAKQLGLFSALTQV
jgi:uncharacterized protein (TIGR01244 family)